MVIPMCYSSSSFSWGLNANLNKLNALALDSGVHSQGYGQCGDQFCHHIC